MQLIDIDKIEEIGSHVHYLNSYKGSVILMDKHSKLFRFNINFSIEHKPLGEPVIKVAFLEHPHLPVIGIIKKVKERILEMIKNGDIASLHKNKKNR